jgi:hypothetical protein
VDLDHAPAQLTYTVTTAPQYGHLELTTAPGVAITSFTQADLDAGHLIYVHDGTATTSDSFTFTVSDPAGGTLGATTFTVAVTPFFPPPDGGVGGGTGTGGTGSGTGIGTGSGPSAGPITGGRASTGNGTHQTLLEAGLQTGTILHRAEEGGAVGAGTGQRTEETKPRPAVSTNLTIARLEPYNVVRNELPVMLSEPLTLPVKSVLAVGQKLAEQLAKLGDSLERGFQEQAQRAQLTGRVASVSGMALSAGFVAWLVRGGALMASFLVSMPAWRHFDPLPVLGLNDGARRQRERQAREADRQEQQQYRGLDRVLTPSRPDATRRPGGG